MRWSCRKRAAERGAIAPLVAILAVPMIAISSLAVDVGFARLESRKAQNATDAAAIAAAQKLPIGHEAALNEAARVASLNGFSNATGTTVTVSHPPVSGPNAGNTEYVEVVIDRSIGTRLGGVIGKKSITVTAR